MKMTAERTYKYRSPYRPLVLSYVPKDVEWVYEGSTIGQWTKATVYAFDKPLPASFVEQWSLEQVS